VAALLMVSRFSYPHPTKQVVRGRGRFPLVVLAVLAGGGVGRGPHPALLLPFWSYAPFSPPRGGVGRGRARPPAPGGRPRGVGAGVVWVSETASNCERMASACDLARAACPKAARLPQRITAVPHASPAPKPDSTTNCPGRTFPSLTASSSARGTLPADVLP